MNKIVGFHINNLISKLLFDFLESHWRRLKYIGAWKWHVNTEGSKLCKQGVSEKREMIGFSIRNHAFRKIKILLINHWLSENWAIVTNRKGNRFIHSSISSIMISMKNSCLRGMEREDHLLLTILVFNHGYCVQKDDRSFNVFFRYCSPKLAKMFKMGDTVADELERYFIEHEIAVPIAKKVASSPSMGELFVFKPNNTRFHFPSLKNPPKSKESVIIFTRIRCCDICCLRISLLL